MLFRLLHVKCERLGLTSGVAMDADRSPKTLKRAHTKPIHEGQYAAEIDVELIAADNGWSPYLSLEDAQKLDEVRKALRRGDIKQASQLARVYQLMPITV